MTPAHLGSSRYWEKKEEGGSRSEKGDIFEEGKAGKRPEEKGKNIDGKKDESGSKFQQAMYGRLSRSSTTPEGDRRREKFNAGMIAYDLLK